MTTSRTIVATDDDDGQRLDVVVARHLADVSRRVARAYGHGGRLFVEGRACAPSYRVRAGARVELRLDEVSAAPPVRLLRVTPRLLYALKPAGMHVHRLRPDDAPSVADAVAHHFRECRTASVDPREGGAVHRLDGPTSGVVAFARNRETYDRARAAFSAQRVEKLYVAWCRAPTRQPWPPPGLASLGAIAPWRNRVVMRKGVRVDAPLRATAGGAITVRPDGQTSRTDVWCVGLRRGPHGADALMLLRLVTGRRHQARVHLAHLGWPIVGDDRYGPTPTPPPATPLMLHAWRLDLRAAEPAEVAVTAPWPVALSRAWGHPGAGRGALSTP